MINNTGVTHHALDKITRMPIPYGRELRRSISRTRARWPVLGGSGSAAWWPEPGMDSPPTAWWRGRETRDWRILIGFLFGEG